MKGLDLSKLKKVSSDKDSTTFAHNDGHTLKVAHSGLSAKMQEDLAKLPLCNGGKVKRYAEGGDTPNPQPNPSDDSSSTPAPQAPVNIYVGPSPNPQPNSTPAPQNGGASASWGAQPNPQPNSSPQDAQAVDPNSPAGATGAAPTPPLPQDSNAPAPGQVGPPAPAGTPSSSPDTNPPAATQAQIPIAQGQSVSTHQDVKQDLTAQDLAWQNDLNNGHITPETYASLFANKSTLGKIGSVFGMLLSGAGSGLAHQPNALLEIMDKQISNDLDAQKNSKANAQNFLRLNQQNLMNQAQIKNLGIDSQTKSYALSQAQMLQSSYHNLVTQVSKMPEGAQKEAAKQQLGFVYSKIADKVNNINDQAAGASAYYNTLFPNQTSSGSNPEQNFQKQTAGMKMLGAPGEARAKDMEEKHFPGLQGQASIPLTADDRTQINDGITFQNQLQKFQAWTAAHSGDLSPSDKNEGAALAADLQGAYRRATKGGVYKAGEQDFISGIIDSEPTKFFNKIRVAPQLKAVQSDSQQQLDQFVKSKGYAGYSGPAKSTAAPTSQIPEGATGTYQGKPVVRKNGKWVHQ